MAFVLPFRLQALSFGLALALINAGLLVCSSTHAALEQRRADVELRATADLIVEFYTAMRPQRRKEAEARWEWVHVLEAAADIVPPLDPKRAPPTSLAAEERLDKRIDELDSKLSDLRVISDRMSQLIRPAD